MAYPRLIVRRPIARLFRLLNPKRSQRKARVSVGSDDPSITTTSTVSRSYPSSEATAEAPIGNIYPKRLCEGEIRLLVILPSENPGDQVRCELHDHKLGDLPPYEALSYVWGDATQRSDMVCDGQSFSVTRSLGNALHRLRQPSIRRILWADAICINQEDIIERNQQVRLMGKIYSMARRVVVWLSNPPTTETNSAVTARFIQTVSDACREFAPNAKEVSVVPPNYSLVQIEVDHLSNQVREDLKAIFSSAWFERIWCIQEIRFSHDAVVIWSNLEILWQDIGLVASWLSEFDYRNPFSHGLGHLSNAYMLYTPLAENKFLDMLDIYKFFKATDPRDKVYGLLGLLSAMPETAVLTVDYQKPLSEVYADTALAALKTSKSLDVLAFVSHPLTYKRKHKFSSWAPQWSDEKKPSRLYTFPEFGSASKTLSFLLNKNINPIRKGLLVEGLPFGSIVSTRSIQHAPDGNLSSNGENTIRNLFKQFVKPVGMKMPETVKRMEKLARTLTMNVVKDNSDVICPLSASSDAERYYDDFLAWIDWLFDRDPDNDRPCIESLKSQKGGGDPKHWQGLATTMTSRRAFFHINNGSYGIGPRCVQEGDIVAVLFGGKTPYVLRPRGEKYSFLGEAYVDGIMYGELVDDMEARKIQPQVFRLI